MKRNSWDWDTIYFLWSEMVAIGAIFIVILPGLGILFGSAIQKNNGFGNDYQRGERAGVQLCIQNPKVCKVKYDYWNLKGNNEN